MELIKSQLQTAVEEVMEKRLGEAVSPLVAKETRAIVEKMWDLKEQIFSDIDPATGMRTMVKAATCFYPYMTDIVTEEHLPGLTKHLLDPK